MRLRLSVLFANSPCMFTSFCVINYFRIKQKHSSNSLLIRGHSKMTSPQKYQILDSLPPYVTISHFFQYTLSPCVIRQIVTNFPLDWRPQKIILHILYNWYIINLQHVWISVKPVPSPLSNVAKVLNTEKTEVFNNNARSI